ncbi:MAG: hypothetical protein ACOZQL_41485 [Myxococcota bacterium]
MQTWRWVLVVGMVSGCGPDPNLPCSKVSLGANVDSIHTAEASPPWYHRHHDLTLKGPVAETECCAPHAGPTEACLALRAEVDCSAFADVRFVSLVDYSFFRFLDVDDAFFCLAAVQDGKLITVHGFIEDN